MRDSFASGSHRRSALAAGVADRCGLRASDNLPPPAELAAEIVESLEAALEEFRAVEEALAPSAE